ncbi:MAG: hypothetical protein MR531_03645 [Lachnospiraceae bacterium]|nr:hypothetical protein [Lachnospiraceae bacterium]
MKIKKILAATLAATMVMASALTVCAASTQSGGESYAPQTQAEKATVSANASVKVGGVEVKTSVAGVYAAEKVQGCAVKTDLATVKANLGLKTGQNPKIVVYDTDPKKSDKAMASVNAAAEAAGASVVATLNVDLGAVEKGKWVTLTDGSVAMGVGLPKGADTTKTYVIICVQPGGETTILEDLDTDPKTVTFNVKAGLGTYALAAK